METLNRSRTLSFTLRRTCRFAFRDWLSGRYSSTVQSPTIIAGTSSSGRQRLELRRNLFDGIGFEDIAGFQIAVPLHPDPAFVALLNLAHVVLEPAERPEFSFEHHHVVANHPNSAA